MVRLFTFALLLSLCSCTTYYTQLFEVKPKSQLKTDKEALVFENDTVRIVYNFWEPNGTMGYTITNKLNAPLYIDWKRSSYIKDGQRINYWEDETLSTSVNSSTTVGYRSYYYGTSSSVSYTAGRSSGREYRPRQIDFIPPRAYLVVSQFSIINAPVGLTKGKINVSTRPRTDNGKSETKVFYWNYPPEESLLKFRNFITLSTSRDFKSETTVDNEFFVSQLTFMESRQFKGKCDYDACEYPFEDSARFYINLTKNQSKAAERFYRSNN